MATQAPDAAATTSTYVNTWPTHPQIIPTVTLSSIADDGTIAHAGVPLVAIIILAVAGGLFAFFLIYRGYRAWWSYRHNKKMAYESPTSTYIDKASRRASDLPFVNSEASLNALARPYHRFRDSSYSTVNVPEEKGIDTPDSPLSPSSATLLSEKPLPNPTSQQKLHPSYSTDYLRSNGGRNSVGSLSNLYTTNSRASLISQSGSAQNMAGNRRSTANSFSSQPPNRQHRLSGAPHSPFSRVEIVPPQPLGIVGNSVVATDKSTLNFSSASGISGLASGDERETLFDPTQVQYGESSRGMSAQAFSAARAAYLAEGPIHRRSASSPFADGQSSSSASVSPSVHTSSLPESGSIRAPTPSDEGYRGADGDLSSGQSGSGDGSSSHRALSPSRFSAAQSLDARSSPLDRLTQDLQQQSQSKRSSIDSRRTREASLSGSFRSPHSQLDELLSGGKS